MVDFSVCAVLPAGGTGQRMSNPTPKQYSKILGKELFLYTVEAFESASWIKKIVVVVRRDRIDSVKTLLEEYGHDRTIVVEGGSSRHRSIRNGVESLGESLNGHSPPDVVLIHDIVRPFVPETILQEVAIAANEHGAAGVIKPLVSTVIGRNSDGFLDCSLVRSKYRASEMPQGFRFDVIRGAYKKCTDHDMEFGTECLHLAQKYSGTTPKLVDTSYDLWKVTYPKDLYAAEGLIKRQMTSTAVVPSHENADFLLDLVDHLKEDLIEVKVFDDLSTVPQLFRNSVIVFSTCGNIHSVTESYAKVLLPGAILVHLCWTKNELDSDATADLLQKMALTAAGEDQPRLIVNAVVCRNSSPVTKVSKILSSLVKDRRIEYSGQVFFC